jgi:hypothetical protein
MGWLKEKALSSNPSPTKKKKKRERERRNFRLFPLLDSSMQHKIKGLERNFMREVYNLRIQASSGRKSGFSFVLHSITSILKTLGYNITSILNF